MIGVLAPRATGFRNRAGQVRGKCGTVRERFDCTALRVSDAVKCLRVKTGGKENKAGSVRVFTTDSPVGM